MKKQKLVICKIDETNKKLDLINENLKRLQIEFDSFVLPLSSAFDPERM